MQHLKGVEKMIKGTIQNVSFDEEEHKYYYEGRELNGVTSAIAKRLGKTFPKNIQVELACSYGSQVHKEIERWIEEGKEPSTDNGKWLKEQLLRLRKDLGIWNYSKYNAEVRVSDFENTASNVDIVLHTPQGVYLADIKTGQFDRQYCTLQLNAYRLMYENCYDEEVLGLFVLNTKAKRVFRIFACEDKGILDLLRGNTK